MSEDKEEQGGPERSNTPDRDIDVAVVIPIVGDLHAALVVIVLGGFKATADQVMGNPRHCGDEKSEAVEEVVESR